MTSQIRFDALSAITVRKQIERALHVSEERFRLLVTHLPVAIFQTDVEGMATFLNEQVGFRPVVAQMLVGPGTELSGIVTSGDLQAGIAHAPRSTRKSG